MVPTTPAAQPAMTSFTSYMEKAARPIEVAAKRSLVAGVLVLHVTRPLRHRVFFLLRKFL